LVSKIAAPGIVSSVAFSPNGRSLGAGLWLSREGVDAGEARIWDVATGAETAHFFGHTDAVRSLAFSPDGSVLATGSMDGSVRKWDLESGRLRATLVCAEVIRAAKREAESAMRKRGLAHEYEPMPLVESVAFSPDGRRIAAAFGEPMIPGKQAGVGVVQLWDATKGEPVGAITHHGNFVAQVCYSRDGSLLATAGGDGSVLLWNAATLKEVATISGDAPVAFAPDGNRLVVSGREASLRLVTIPDRKGDVHRDQPRLRGKTEPR
jgi:WD40 repeat protein